MAPNGHDNLEAALGSSRSAAAMTTFSTWTTLSLAYESLGIVYGDIGTSPLYVYASTFPNGIAEEKDLYGALSLLIWTLTLSPLIKYCVFVLMCHDNGEGGTFALYSLLCRHVNLGRLRVYEPDVQNLSFYTKEGEGRKSRVANCLRNKLESTPFLQQSILTLVFLATSMVIGDGVLTPAQSVLSAIGGIQVKDPSLSQNVVVAVSCVILAALFVGQRYGTHKIAFTFAPIVTLWFFCITGMGIYFMFHYDGWVVLKAFSPHYGIDYLIRNKKAGWISLGGIFLTITGTEAMFADIGHFTPRAVQLAFSSFVYPCLLIAYLGQAAYLRKHPEHVNVTFYKSIPKPIYWPVFVVATAAAAIASQAMISATFSIVKQSVALGCFPHVKIVHKSKKLKGQIYIPEINLVLLVLCLLVTGIMGQKGTLTIANAYGIAVSGVMIITTILVTLALILVKRYSIWVAAPFFIIFFVGEGVYLSSNLYKFPNGGWVPIAAAAAFMTVMSVWRYGAVKKADYDFEHKLSIDWVETAAASSTMKSFNRIPGIGLFYSELTSGIPPIFAHFISNVPSLYEYVIFVSIKHIEVSTIPDNERFFFRRLGPLNKRMFRCIVRYGYADSMKKATDDTQLQEQLVDALVYHLQTEDSSAWKRKGSSGNSHLSTPQVAQVKTPNGEGVSEAQLQEETAIRNGEVAALAAARDAVIVHILGRTYLTAMHKEDTSYVRFQMRKFLVGLYQFLKVNTQDGVSALHVPRANLMEVGMACQI